MVANFSWLYRMDNGFWFVCVCVGALSGWPARRAPALTTHRPSDPADVDGYAPAPEPELEVERQHPRLLACCDTMEPLHPVTRQNVKIRVLFQVRRVILCDAIDL